MVDWMNVLVEAVIAIALFPVLVSFVDSANATGTSGVLLGLIPILYIIILVAAFAYQVRRMKK